MIQIYWNGKDITKNIKYALTDIVLGGLLIWQGSSVIKNSEKNKGTIDGNISIEQGTDDSNIINEDNPENVIIDENDIELPKEEQKETYTYTIRPGDSILALANAFGCSADEIMELNNLSSDLIFAGQQLTIPYIKRVNENVKVGIDVSHWNGQVNWDITKDYIDYAIIRICDFCNVDENGNYELDPTFEQNIKKCNELGIPVGVYAYTRAFDTETAEKESQFVLNAIKDYKIEYPVYIDIETKEHQKMMQTNLPLMVDTVETWCKTIENDGYYVGIYAGDCDMQLLTKSSKYLAQYDKWVARYEDNPAAFIENMKEKNIAYNGKYKMQQAGSVGIVPGIDTNVDVNFAYMDFQQIITNAGLNHLNDEQKKR